MNTPSETQNGSEALDALKLLYGFNLRFAYERLADPENTGSKNIGKAVKDIRDGVVKILLQKNPEKKDELIHVVNETIDHDLILSIINSDKYRTYTDGVLDRERNTRSFSEMPLENETLEIPRGIGLGDIMKGHV